LNGKVQADGGVRYSAAIHRNWLEAVELIPFRLPGFPN